MWALTSEFIFNDFTVAPRDFCGRQRTLRLHSHVKPNFFFSSFHSLTHFNAEFLCGKIIFLFKLFVIYYKDFDKVNLLQLRRQSF